MWVFIKRLWVKLGFLKKCGKQTPIQSAGLNWVGRLRGNISNLNFGLHIWLYSYSALFSTQPTKFMWKKIQWTNNIIAANLWLMFSFWFTIWVGPIFAWTICSSTLHRRYIISPIINIYIEEKNKTDIKYTFFLKLRIRWTFLTVIYFEHWIIDILCFIFFYFPDVSL